MIVDLRTQARGVMPLVMPDLPSLRDMALGTWRGRMVNEYGSSRVFEALAVQLDAAGMDGYLAKPIDAARLAEEIHRVMADLMRLGTRPTG